MKQVMLFAMVILYVGAGIFHFVKPAGFVKIVPTWLGHAETLVFVSGAVEIALGLLLLAPATRPWAAWGLIALLVAVFPANIRMAVIYHERHLPYFWLTLLRLPLQGVLIWWAWIYTRP